MKNRKVILFIISLIAACVMAFFGKDTMAILTLYGIYCTGNCATKFSQKRIETTSTFEEER